MKTKVTAMLIAVLFALLSAGNINAQNQNGAEKKTVVDRSCTEGHVGPVSREVCTSTDRSTGGVTTVTKDCIGGGIGVGVAGGKAEYCTIEKVEKQPREPKDPPQ